MPSYRATRPFKTKDGCCGACATKSGDVLPYDCGTTCSSSPGPGCSSTVPGTSSSPPPAAIASPPPPAAIASPPSSGPSCGSGEPACSEFCASGSFGVTCASPKYGEIVLTYQLSEKIATYTLSVGAKVDFDVRASSGECHPMHPCVHVLNPPHTNRQPIARALCPHRSVGRASLSQ